MKKVTDTVLGRIFLLLSTAAFLVLFMEPSLTWLLIIAAAVVVVGILHKMTSFRPCQCKPLMRYIAMGLGGVLLFLGARSFLGLWQPSSKVAALSEMLHIPNTVLLIGAVTVIILLAAYSVYYLSSAFLYYTFKTDNTLFTLSGIVFMLLCPEYSLNAILAFFASVILLVGFSYRTESVRKYCAESRKPLRILALLSAVGMCLYCYNNFVYLWTDKPSMAVARESIAMPRGLVPFVGAVMAAISVYFVYVCFVFIGDQLIKTAKRGKLFDEIKPAECVLYAVLFAAGIALTVYAFSSSRVFFGHNTTPDIIYTSDTALLIEDPVYLHIFHPENDLRQPLFAVFAAPFMGISYLIARIASLPLVVEAILMNAVQIALLLFTVFTLAKSLCLSTIPRICFVVLFYTTYPYMLFSVMMEQYIVVFFWLVWVLYTASVDKKASRVAVYGATGTLLTSAALLPLLSERSPKTDFKKWLSDIVSGGVGFVFLMLAFNRLDVFLNLFTKIQQLTEFTGQTVTFAEKVNQYFHFVRGCLIAPGAEIIGNAVGKLSWQLAPRESLDCLGMAILALAAISLFLNRRKKSSMLAGCWMLYSAVILILLGWGTQENGLILYALYFGWAYFVLLFQLAETIGEKMHFRFFVPLVSIVSAAALVYVNIPNILEMIRFAGTYYPVL